MPVAVSYPGVYIEEVPSGSRAIAGVPTSVAAFVGYTARGPVNDPIQMFSFADFDRTFGGLHLDSPLSYAMQHFFQNGGATAYVVRVAADAAEAEIAMQNRAGSLALTAIAASEGLWGNMLVLSVDDATGNPASDFNLNVTEMVERNGRLVPARTESHRNLSMNPTSATYAIDTVNAASELITLRDELAGDTSQGTSISRVLPAGIASDLSDDVQRLAVSIDGDPFFEFDLSGPGGLPANLQEICDAIEAAVQAFDPADPAYSNFTCDPNGAGDRIEATSGSNALSSSVRFRRASIRSATATLALGLANGGTEANGAANARPERTGTAGTPVPDLAAGDFADPEDITVTMLDASGATLGVAETFVLQNTAAVPPVNAPASLAEARTRLETAMRNSTQEPIARASVDIVANALVISAGGPDQSVRLDFSDAGAATLGLSGGGVSVNVASYQMGSGPTVAAQLNAVGGADGSPPSDLEIRGERAAKSGIYALEDVDLFNILNLPEVYDISILSAAITYAEERRSMILLDIDRNFDSFDEARAWINDPANASARHRNAVAYWPRVNMADALQGNRARDFANSGVMAGLYARTDAARGVWKAPAGIEARLRGVLGLAYVLSDPENGVLNPLGLNCLRSFPVTGAVSWGARTMVGADALTSEWKYVPIRRLALFIEESLYRGTQFVVFEPNDEPLWSQIRLSVGSFMNNLFRQGAFQGATPQDAYFVRCDSSTTTQADIDLGIVNIDVGFAPLKPAEFVIIRIQQIAGQSQS